MGLPEELLANSSSVTLKNLFQIARVVPLEIPFAERVVSAHMPK